VAGAFNQQIEEFDQYISTAHNLNWNMEKKPIALKSSLTKQTPTNVSSKDKKSLNKKLIKSKHPERDENKKQWLHFTKDSTYYFQIISKGQHIENISKKNISYKIELVNVTPKGVVSVIKGPDHTEAYKTLPGDYKKIITLIGVGGKSLMVINKNNLPPNPDQKTKLYRMEVFQASF
jgi:hypothetical protein